MREKTTNLTVSIELFSNTEHVKKSMQFNIKSNCHCGEFCHIQWTKIIF